MLTEPQPVFAGWTLQQALELTANPQSWNQWLSAKSEYDKLRPPIGSSAGGFVAPSPGVMAKHRLRALDAWNSIVRPFREYLANGTLAAVGSRGERSALPTGIYREGWRTLKILNFERSTVRETGATKTRIYNVRIFPLVHAPDALDRLRGRSIADSFLMSVIRDPEVVAASQRLPEANRHRLVFEQGQYPGPMIQYLWPIALEPKELASDFIRRLVFFPNDPIPRPSAEIVHLAEIMVDRWRGLVRRLVDGELTARGTYALNGELQLIDSFQWARRTLLIDIKNSDLVDRDRGKEVVRWSGVALALPESLQTASQLRSASPVSFKANSNPQGSRRRPISDAVAAALAARQLAKHPGGRSWKELAGLIAADMPKYPQTEAELNALAKAVKRYYAEQRVQS